MIPYEVTIKRIIEQHSKTLEYLHMSEKQDELVEKVARSLAREAYSTGGMERITDPYTPDADYWNALARAALRVALEEAALVAQGMWWQGHGNLATDPYAAAKQAGDEIAAAIRALIVSDA